MKIAKVCSLLLAVLMIFTMMTGCGEKTGQSAPEPDKPAAAEPTKKAEPSPAETVADDGKLKAPDKEMTITLWDIATAEPAVTIQPAAG